MTIRLPKRFTWHVIPYEPIKILSIVEFATLIIVLGACYFLFSKWNSIPTRQFIIKAEDLGSEYIHSCNVEIVIPVTTHHEFIGKEIKKKGALSISFDKSSAINPMKFLEKKGKYLDSLNAKYDSIFPSSKQRFYTYTNQSRPKSMSIYLASEVPKSTKLYNVNLGQERNSVWQETYRATPDNLIYRAEKQWYDILGLTSTPLETPKWSWLEDISQAYIDVKVYSQTIDSFKLKIDFVGVTDFSVIMPKPDSISLSGIEYNSKSKIRDIKNNGLRFYAKFPEMQNRQDIRLLAITAIMSGLLLSLAIFIFRSIFAIINSLKK